MKKTLDILLVLVGVVCVILAFVYWMTPANALPSYLPGYSPTLATVHFKHGLGALIVGFALFVWVWFRTGKKAAGVSGSGK